MDSCLLRKITGSTSADGFTSLTGTTGPSEIGCLRRGASNSYLYGINECCHQLLSHENCIQCSNGLGTNNLPGAHRLHRGEEEFRCYYGFTVDLGLLGVEGVAEVRDPR